VAAQVRPSITAAVSNFARWWNCHALTLAGLSCIAGNVSTNLAKCSTHSASWNYLVNVTSY